MKDPTYAYAEQAVDQTKHGGNIQKGQIFALLAIAEAVDNLAAELRGMGTELHPIHVNGGGS